MSNIPMSRRQFARLVFGGFGTAAVASGCAAPAVPAAAKVIVIILTWVGIIATTGYLVLRAEEQYWKVESAKLDMQRKQLELEGVKNGQRAKGIQELNDQHLAALLEYKRVRIEFKDGQSIELPVTV